jgi:hypothetical protein
MSSKEEKCEEKGGCCHAWQIKSALNKDFERSGKEKRFFPIERSTRGTFFCV